MIDIIYENKFSVVYMSGRRGACDTEAVLTKRRGGASPWPDPETATLTPTEIADLVSRLRAGADSALLREEPEMQRDMRAAATILDQLVQLHAEIRDTETVVDGIAKMLDFMVGR